MIYINPYLSLPINTIIGGVAGTISTKADLAAKLGVSESIITRFQIVGSDVHCRISSDYSIVGSAFEGDTSITSYIDLNARCIAFGSNAFYGATNLANVYAPNAYLGSKCFVGAINLTNSNYGGEYLYFNSDINGGISDIKLKKFTAPNLNYLPASFAQNNIYFEELNANIVAIPDRCFQGATALDVMNTDIITSLGSSSMVNVKLSGIRHFTSLTSAVGGISGWKSTEIHMPNLTSYLGINTLQNFTNLTLLSMRKLKTLGNSPSTVSSLFSGLKLGCTIEMNVALATANSGSAHAALVWAKTNRAAIVKFYDDAGNYVSTL